MASEKGIVKKIELKNFSAPRKGGIRAINLQGKEDVLIGVKKITEKQEIMLATKKGLAIRFSANNVRAMGRASYGVTGIKMDDEDEVVSLEVIPTEDQSKFSILTVTRNGYGKRSEIEDYRLTGRAGKGVINMRVTDKTGDIVTSQSVTDKDNIIVMTKNGIVIRTPITNIRIMGRATQGVRVINLKNDDRVVDLTRVPTDEEVEQIIKSVE
jgi:DNA gyrase subunit A